MFIKENKDIFLVDVDIPDDVRERYFSRNLTIEDLIEYEDVLQKIPIDSFMSHSTHVHEFFWKNYGQGKFQELVKKYPKIFLHLSGESSVSGLYNFYIITN